MITHFDHINSFLKSNRLQETIDRFKRAGFLDRGHTVRHPAGNLNGFVQLTFGDLEFISIVDEDEFEREASVEDKYFRKVGRPTSIGAVFHQPDQTYLELNKFIPDLTPPFSRGRKDAEDPTAVVWTFLLLPHTAFPGAEIFCVRYHKYIGQTPELRKGPNSIYGITGYVFCSDNIESDIARWLDLLRPISQDVRRVDNSIEMPLQKLKWISPQEYEALYGQPWVKHPYLCGNIAAVILGADDLKQARSMLTNENFGIASESSDLIQFQMDEETRFTLWIESGNSGEFLKKLIEVTQAATLMES